MTSSPPLGVEPVPAYDDMESLLQKYPAGPLHGDAYCPHINVGQIDRKLYNRVSEVQPRHMSE